MLLEHRTFASVQYSTTAFIDGDGRDSASSPIRRHHDPQPDIRARRFTGEVDDTEANGRDPAPA
jgi:hypothetical protein